MVRWQPFVPVLVAFTLLVLSLALVTQLTDGPVAILAVLATFTLAALLRHPIAAAVNGMWLRRSKVAAPGDYIRLEGREDIEGYVERVGWRDTELQTPLGDVARVPNTVLANSVFTNFHLPNSGNDVVVDIDMEANASPVLIEKLLAEEAHPDSVPGIEHGSLRVRRLPGRFPGCQRYVIHGKATRPADRDRLSHDLAHRIEDRLRRERIATPSLSTFNKDRP